MGEGKYQSQEGHCSDEQTGIIRLLFKRAKYQLLNITPVVMLRPQKHLSLSLSLSLSLYISLCQTNLFADAVAVVVYLTYCCIVELI
jgi:hypothetical protein